MSGYDQATIDRVLEMYQAEDELGRPQYTIRDIQKEVGFNSPGSVNNIVRQSGIPMRREAQVARYQTSQAKAGHRDITRLQAENEELREQLVVCQDKQTEFAQRGIDVLMGVYRLGLNPEDLEKVIDLLNDLLRPTEAPLAERRKTA
jgi:hypothetical protein